MSSWPCFLMLAFQLLSLVFCIYHLPLPHLPTPFIWLVQMKPHSPTQHVASGWQPGLAAWRAFLWVRKGSSDACPCLCVWAGNVASVCGNVGSSSVERSQSLSVGKVGHFFLWLLGTQTARWWGRCWWDDLGCDTFLLPISLSARSFSSALRGSVSRGAIPAQSSPLHTPMCRSPLFSCPTW